MMKLKRDTAPDFHLPNHLRRVNAVKMTGDSGVPVYYIPSVNGPIVRMDFIFQAGTRYQDTLFSSGCANNLLVEGTDHYTGAEIAEIIDYYGSYIYPFYDRDEAGITAIFLQKHYRENLKLIFDLLQHPVFPTSEIDIFRTKKTQQLILDRQRTDRVAYRNFMQSLLGTTHPYSIHGEPEDLKYLNHETLQRFHQKHYHPASLGIILTCEMMDENYALLEELLSEWSRQSLSNESSNIIPQPTTNLGEPNYSVIPEATQVAIRLGLEVPGPDHPDYQKISIMNTLLGGYFGSRLMQNIREEKGLTYGIGSAVVSFKEFSFLTVASSVSKDNYQQAIDECQLEMAKLKQEPIAQSELITLRNYLTGDLQRQLDGAFTSADTFKDLLSSGLDFEYIHQFLKTLNSINATLIQDTAQEYLDLSKLVISSAGPAH